MSLSSISIKRPVLAIVMSVTIVLFGILGAAYLGVREYPALDPPIINVSTGYIGANAEVIESQITEPLEESISGIAGIRSMTSVSREGRSSIRIEFDLEVDLEAAANDVRDKVSGAMRLLPPDVDPPVVSKADADAFPIIMLGIRSSGSDVLQLTDFARTVKERLQTIPGVSQVHIWGEKRYSMRLWMDPAKLAAKQLTPLDIKTAIDRENIELPSGRIEGQATELTIKTMARLKNPEEFNNLIIKEVDGRVVRFSDVGRAVLGPENERTAFRGDGEQMVAVVLVAQQGSNHIAIADEFYKRLEHIKRDVPAGYQMSIGFDMTQFVRSSIREVLQTIFAAFILVVLVIYAFLRDWRTTVIPIVAVPISLVGSFFVMYAAGFSINVLTLLGIVLAIGLVVDDAIVMLENIYRKVEGGMPPLEAGFKGASEIFFAIVATTLALIAVFLPVIFLQGFTGRLFREFGIVIAGSVVISSFVALTLTPMMSTRVLRQGMKHSRFYLRSEPFFNALATTYERSLTKLMGRRRFALIVVGVAAVGIVIFGLLLPSELAPLEDRSRLIVNAVAPEGASFEYMDQYMNDLEKLSREVLPEKQAILTITSPGWSATGSVNSGFMVVMLKDPAVRDGRTQQEIAGDLSVELRQLSSARVYVTQLQTIGIARFGLPVQYVLQAPSFERLQDILPKFAQEASRSPVFTVVDVNLKFNKPELRVDIDRERAKALNVSALDIAQTLQLGLSGQRFGYFVLSGKQYQIIGQVTRESRSSPVDLKSLFVKNRQGEMIQLDNVVTVTEQISPPQLYRFSRYISATVSAGLAPGYTIADGIRAMDEIKKKVLDETFTSDLDGPSRDYAESSSTMEFTFLLALALIYLVLAAQFESFRDPLIIMFTVPLAIAGALFSLWYFNQTLNIFSQIGQVMLIGLVTKNGILIVEFANQRRAKGLSKLDAVIDAAVARFRPILMTSLTTILGYMPIALALGAGAESRRSMGIAVIGGLVFSTVLTLYVIPAMYTFLAKRDEKIVPEPADKQWSPEKSPLEAEDVPVSAEK